MLPSLKFSTLALLLTAMQATPPAPRKVASDASNLSDDCNKHGKENKAIADSAQIQNTVGPWSNENSNQPPTTQQKDEHIVVDRLPDKDRWDKIYICSTIALVLVGFATLGIVLYQAIKTRDAAKATLSYVKAFIESQRPQLAISFDDPIPVKPPKIRAKITNTGLTPAYSCDCETWTEVVPHPFKDFTSAATYHKLGAPMTIYPNAPRETIAEVWLDRDIEPDELSEIYSGRKDICFRIRIKYRDAFQKCRWQDFGFLVIKGGMSYLPKYNDSGECEKPSQKTTQN